MKPFAYVKAATQNQALRLISSSARPKGGGVDLLDLAKSGVSLPETLVDLPLNTSGIGMGHGTKFGGGLPRDFRLIPAGLTLAHLAADRPESALTDAAGMAATPLVRNVATLAGNVLQRPRCAYYRDPFFDCLKRGGKTCPAMEGNHAEGAIFGNGRCCAVHPSNLAVSLFALEARAICRSVDAASGEVQEEQVPIDEAFFVTPEQDPLREARIGPGDLITEILISWVAEKRPSSAYVEVDQKQSFDWASASCAAVLRLEGGKVKWARIVLGAVAPVPWRAMAAEEALAGEVPDEASATAAAEAAVKDATPLRDNAHKVQHARVCVKRAILKAAGRGR